MNPRRGRPFQRKTKPKKTATEGSFDNAVLDPRDPLLKNFTDLLHLPSRSEHWVRREQEKKQVTSYEAYFSDVEKNIPTLVDFLSIQASRGHVEEAEKTLGELEQVKLAFFFLLLGLSHFDRDRWRVFIVSLSTIIKFLSHVQRRAM